LICSCEDTRIGSAAWLGRLGAIKIGPVVALRYE
jgi:hypothetical protein